MLIGVFNILYYVYCLENEFVIILYSYFACHAVCSIRVLYIQYKLFIRNSSDDQFFLIQIEIKRKPTIEKLINRAIEESI